MSTIDTMPMTRSGGGSSLGGSISAAFAFVWSSYRARRQMRHTRLDLLDLTDDQLKDIGISREAAEREALRSTINRYLHGVR